MGAFRGRATGAALHAGRSVCASRLWSGVAGAVVDAAGGPARARIVIILAAVLGLNGADQATIAATADNLERAFGVGNTAIGLLATVVALAGAAATLPVGVLTDRVRRTRLLAASIAAWSAAILCAGMAGSYTWLLIARIALGAVTATAGPTVASLIGDYFPAADRGRVYGLILGGDLAGTGFGFIVSGEISSILSWRFAFWWLMLPGLALTWLVWRLAEPARGGQGALGGAAAARRDTAAEAVVRRAAIEPQPELVLHADPTGRSVWWAIGYVLRLRTNLIIIVASALGYFFFSGLRSFAVLYVIGHYGVSKPVGDALLIVIGAAALAGVFAGGRVSDRLLRRGHSRARIIVPAACLLALVPVMAPAIATTSVALALPLFAVGAFLLGAPNPPMDAARLDIVHPRLWGRAEGVRTVLRMFGEAGAPLIFGYVSQYVFGSPAAPAGTPGQGSTSHAAASGLEYTFLIFLILLLAAGLLALLALRTYPRDVATATASRHAIGRGSGLGERPSAPDRPAA